MVQLAVTQRVTFCWNSGSEQMHVWFVGAQRPPPKALAMHGIWTPVSNS